MKVLISVFQVGLMVMVGLFAIGALEVVSYRTINPTWFQDRVALMNHEEHWTIRITQPYWLKPIT